MPDTELTVDYQQNCVGSFDKQSIRSIYMNFISFEFIGFVFALIFLYYITPLKIRCYVLLIGSVFFYFQAGWQGLVFLGIAALITYASGLAINTLRRSAHKQEEAFTLLVISLLFLLAMLLYVKIGDQLIEAFDQVLQGERITISTIVPLGISYYTFAAIGYLLDIYWKKDQPEKNPFKQSSRNAVSHHSLRVEASRISARASAFVATSAAFLSCDGLVSPTFGHSRTAFVAATYATYAFLSDGGIFLSSGPISPLGSSQSNIAHPAISARGATRIAFVSFCILHLLLSHAAAGCVTRAARLDSAARNCPPGRFHRLFHG